MYTSLLKPEILLLSEIESKRKSRKKKKPKTLIEWKWKANIPKPVGRKEGG